jgi:predicted transcriptional regulator
VSAPPAVVSYAKNGGKLAMEHYLKTPINLLLDKELKPTDKIIFQYLLWRQGNNSDSWAAIRTIAEDLGLSGSTVQISINQLVKNNIVMKKSGKRGKGNSNHYTIIVPKISTITPDDCTENQHSIVPKISTGGD